MIELHSIVVLHADSEIIHPSLNVEVRDAYRYCMDTPQLRPVRRRNSDLNRVRDFLRDSKPFACEGETEKRTLLSFHDFAFVPVDLDLEFPLKEPADTCHYTMTGTFRLHQYGKIIRVACEPMTSFLQLLVEVIQKDIAQQRRQEGLLAALPLQFGSAFRLRQHRHEDISR